MEGDARGSWAHRAVWALVESSGLVRKTWGAAW